ncbi:MAG: hypothetical protein M3Z36_09275 [Acidobacteriota bacterium]|nr:hypothetical protein [Acidobacteriota bacterium]
MPPILLLMIAVFAGTVWLIVPVQSKGPPESPIRPAVVERQFQPVPEQEPLLAESALLLKNAESLRKDREAAQRESKAVALEQQRIFVSFQQQQRRLESFKSGLGNLDAIQTTLRTQAEKVLEAERLESALLKKKADLAKLESEVNSTQSPFARQIGSLPRATPANKVPVLVELFRERAIPVDKKHFHLDIPMLSGPTLATRTDIGETAEQILSPASSFAKFLDRIKPDKQYVACLLNDDSFNIFREVRTMAKARGIAVGWEPIDSSSGRITIHPIHFSKGPAKAAQTEKGKDAPRVTAIIE